VTLDTFFQLIDKKIVMLKDYDIATSHSELDAIYLLQIGQCNSKALRTALDQWNVMTKPMQTWTRFKKHFAEADKKCCTILKASADNRKAAYQE